MALTVPFNDLGRLAPELRAQLDEAVARVLDSGWYVLGPENERFEQLFSDYLGIDHVLGTGNGTDALELALKVLGVGPGSRVVTVANAGGYTSVAASRLGATPVLVDVDSEHLIDIESLQRALEHYRPAAVVITHLHGAQPDMPNITQICADAQVPMVEDCAQATGSRSEGRAAGTWGAISTFSFYPTKNLGALGDGGAVATSDSGLADRARELRQYGWGQKYRIDIPGGQNSRLDELQAAILSARLPYLDGDNKRRVDIVRRYQSALPRGYRMLHLDNDSYVGHLAVIAGPSRDLLRAHLAENGVKTDIHYPVLDSDQPGLACVTLGIPATQSAPGAILSLPCFPELREEEINHVCETLQGFETE